MLGVDHDFDVRVARQTRQVGPGAHETLQAVGHGTRSGVEEHFGLEGRSRDGRHDGWERGRDWSGGTLRGGKGRRKRREKEESEESRANGVNGTEYRSFEVIEILV